MPDKALKLFVNYRRADESVFVELLRTHFMFRYERENVFMDFYSIPPFTRFADYIKSKVSECDVMVAIIGPRWLELLRDKEAKGEPDYARIELKGSAVSFPETGTGVSSIHSPHQAGGFYRTGCGRTTIRTMSLMREFQSRGAFGNIVIGFHHRSSLPRCMKLSRRLALQGFSGYCERNCAYPACSSFST
jgi:hypothetical protein